MSATTNATGYYEIPIATLGSHDIALAPISGWQQTWPTTTSLSVTLDDINHWVGADFGSAQGAIYGWLWDDANLNSEWETDDEAALEGWTVYLDANNNGVLNPGEETTTTDANGYYVFGGLASGTYTVNQVLQSGWENAWPGTDGATVTVSNADLWRAVSFGNAKGTVYGWLWDDMDLNTEWETEDEPPLEGWTVYLDANKNGILNAGEESTTTDANGYYVFGGLASGTYTVNQVLQSGWDNTWPGSDGASLTVSNSELWQSISFGNAKGTIYGWLWDDANLNTEWETDDEAALEGRTVFLDTNKNGELNSGEPSTITDANGYYVFGGLGPGSYTVAQVVQSGWQETWPGDDGHEVTLSNEDLWQVASFGSAQGAIFGWLWDDTDIDLIWDTDSEAALSNRTVFVDANANGQLDVSEVSTTTDENGYYILSGLTTGTYLIDQIVPAGWGQTWPGSEGHSISITTENLWVEAGFGTAQGAVYGWFWDDMDLDAIWDAEEPVLSGRTVYVDANNNGALDSSEPSAITDENGYYFFGGLTVGTHTLRQVIPSGWSETWPGVDGASVELSNSDLWMNASFGSARGTVYGWLWNDVDLDATRDAEEPVLEGWTVFIDTNENGILESGETSTTSDEHGYYVFGGLANGEYNVNQVVPLGWEETWPGGSGHTASVSDENLWVEAGFGNAQGAIYGWLWEDLDLDAIWDAGEPILEGRTVYLDANNNGSFDAGEQQTITDTFGYYVFGEVPQGTYRVGQVVPSGWQQTWPSGDIHDVTVDTDNLWVEAGFGSARGSIYGWVWNDADINALRESEETILEGWTVFLDANEDGILGDGEVSTISDATGYYAFGGIESGEHKVVQLIPEGWQQSWPSSEGHIANITSDEPWVEASFGHAMGTVYGWLWHDTNLDAIRDAEEQPLEGWNIFIDSNDNGVMDIGEQNAVSNSLGYYAISDVDPGEHTVAQVPQVGWNQTWPVLESHTVTVSNEGLWQEAGFGNAQGTIYGWAWNDANSDGIWDEEELPLPDWTVFLDSNKNGLLDDNETSAITGDSGYYVFESLAFGEYTVAQVLSDDWVRTWPDESMHSVSLSESIVWAETYFGNREVTRSTVSVSASDASATEASGDSGEFTISRVGSTDGDLTVQLSINGTASVGSDYNEIPSSVVIPDGESSVVVPLDTVEDFAAEQTETVVVGIELDEGYSIGTSNSATATILDNDIAGITVSAAEDLQTAESGATVTFSIVLDTLPSDDVTIPIETSKEGEGTLVVTSLTFSPANWNTPQLVTVTGEDDSVDDGDIDYSIITGAAVSLDENYAGIDPDDIAISNVDDDEAGFDISPTSITTTEAGGEAAFTIRLKSKPLSVVSVPITSGDPAEASVSTESLEFSPDNWMVAQSVTVTGKDDSVADGPVSFSVLIGPATSTDETYDKLDPPDVAATNSDNETAGISITPTTGLTVDESGASNTFSVVLNTAPTADVTIAIRSGNEKEAVVDEESLVFVC